MSIVFNLRSNKIGLVSVVYFIILGVWWLTIFWRGIVDGIENEIFTDIYFLVSLWGGVFGLLTSRQWGGYRSVFGRAIGAFSLGLLGQAFGQVFYNFYALVLGVEVPYPSIGDFGFFSTGIFYGYGAIQLIKAAGGVYALRSKVGKVAVVIIPVIWAGFSYWFFLRGYEMDWSQPLVLLLDMVSPIIDSAYLALAVLVYVLSRKWLGGMMKWPILLLLIAIVSEAVTDFQFLYQVSRETWYVGGTNDFMYLVTYTLMALALAQIGASFKKVTEDNG
jgi:hypothetical protein